jgi:hypothetical protein
MEFFAKFGWNHGANCTCTDRSLRTENNTEELCKKKRSTVYFILFPETGAHLHLETGARDHSRDALRQSHLRRFSRSSFMQSAEKVTV